jgi:clan AA aspartic protease
MGKVIVKIKLTNLFEQAFFSRGLAKRKPRSVETEALVDTGATRLYLKPSVIKKLGLQRVDTVRSQTTNGEAIRYKYDPVQLELMGRKENFDVIEVPESVPNLLGQVPLEVLDLVVDSKGQKLIANPAHGGEQMTEEYCIEGTGDTRRHCSTAMPITVAKGPPPGPATADPLPPRARAVPAPRAAANRSPRARG